MSKVFSVITSLHPVKSMYCNMDCVK